MKKIVNILSILYFGSLPAQNMNVGINTESPQETLHVKGTMRFEPVVSSSNPAAAAGKTLTSDASGNATWKSVSFNVSKAITASYGNGVSVTRTGGGISNAEYTGTYIELPPGTWIVSFAMNVNVVNSNNNAISNSQSVWVRSSLFDTTTSEDYTNSSLDILDLPLISKEITGPATNTIMIGEFTVKNSSSANKKYYYKVSIENAGFGNNQTSKLVSFGNAPQTTPTNRLTAHISQYAAQ